MTAESQRLAIAEFCGWSVQKTPGTVKLWRVLEHHRLHSTFTWNDFGARLPDPTLKEVVQDLPNYLNDLNAMHEAVSILTDEQYNAEEGFTTRLARVCGYDEEDGFDFRPMQEATAAQRAEALLRTIGKWED